MNRNDGYSSTEVGYVRSSTAAAENPYFQTAAAPTSFASVIRGSVIVRNAASPISYPFHVEHVTGHDDGAC